MKKIKEFIRKNDDVVRVCIFFIGVLIAVVALTARPA